MSPNPSRQDSTSLQYPPYAISVENTGNNKETPTKRSPLSSDSLIDRPRLRGYDGVDENTDDRPNTLYELMKWCGETWGDKECFGWRDVLEVGG